MSGQGCVTETGRIVAVRGETVEVEIARSAECARCGLCARSADGAMRFEIPASGFEVGGLVRVTFPYKSRWRSIFWVFLVPLVLFFGAGLGASILSSGSGVSAGTRPFLVTTACAAGLAAGAAAARFIDRRFREDLRANTRLEKLEEPEAPGGPGR